MTTIAELIGGIISNCGVLEHFVNILIKGLSKDDILSCSTTKYPFNKRLILLKDLLKQRSGISKDEIDKINNKLVKISKNRNEIAHCIVVQESEDKHISVFDWDNGECKIKKLEIPDLIGIYQETKETISELSVFSVKLLNQQSS